MVGRTPSASAASSTFSPSSRKFSWMNLPGCGGFISFRFLFIGDTEAPRLLEPLGFRLNAKKPDSDRWIQMDKLRK